MLEKGARLGSLKHEVLLQVAKAAFEEQLEQRREEIPFDIIKGPQPLFRCCVYREREIIRQRVRLAEGKAPIQERQDKNIVQVINSACEDCPITRFTVTDNCQLCMSKRCQESCNFGAISMEKNRAYIDPGKCRECGKCATACPYNAIADLMRPCKKSCPVDAISMDEHNIVEIKEDRCIQCGACIKDCPFGAIADRSFLVDVINLLQSKHKVYACVAPAIEGQFGKEVSMGVLAKAVKELGFEDFYEVALGADFVAKSEAKEWAEAYEHGEKKTTSCCPAFVTMIKKHYPQVAQAMSSTVSPMNAIARLIKTMDPEAIVVFIGPCIAKKAEVLENVTQDTADYAITFEELEVMFQAKGVEFSKEVEDIQQGSIYGKRFATSGGVTGAVLQSLKEMGIEEQLSVNRCNGAAECKKALLLLKAGRLPEDFIEGMICEGGCVNGPAALKRGPIAKREREQLLAKANQREIREYLEEYKDMDIALHKK